MGTTVGGRAAAQETAPAQGDNGFEAARLDFSEAFRTGLVSGEIAGGWSEQHPVPSGIISHLDGPGLHLSRLRFSQRRTQKGLELSLRALSHNGDNSQVWSAEYVRRQWFHVQRHHALYWQVGGGLVHLSESLPEEAAHTNFVEHVGVGAAFAASRRTAWMLEYRFFHISCAGRMEPNKGINGSEFLLGRSVYF